MSPFGLNYLYCFKLKLYIIIYKSIHLFKNIFLIYLGIFILFITIIFIDAIFHLFNGCSEIVIVIEVDQIVVGYLMNTTINDILNRDEDLIF